MKKQMERNQLRCLVFLLLAFFPRAAMAGGGHEHGHSHGHEDEGHDEVERGPHGGRMLEKGDFALELIIFETGEEPTFRVYAFEKGRPLSLEGVEVEIELQRFARDKEVFQLRRRGEFLTDAKVVSEPHSFDVHVHARRGKEQLEWSFSSHEGRTELSSEALKVAELEIETAGAAEIFSVSQVYGKLLPNQDKVAHVIPRFSGVIREIRKELGDRVEKGETLAVVESNQSLQAYEVKSQIAGEVIARHATMGEFIPENVEIFVVADLSEVWADFQVYRDDFGEIGKGQDIKIDLGDGGEVSAKVRYVSPVTDEATQSKLIRAVMPNAGARLRPGLFVSGTLSSGRSAVPIAVKREALQTFRDWNVVYLTDGHTFQAMPVETGRRDTKMVEILSGLRPGDRYVTKNSYIIKADIEKSGASHDH
jgi:membrane fusion protein, heavy metal efflux system